MVIAHRGAHLEARENTIAAFEQAVELKADGIELDVRLSPDLTPIVAHDDWMIQDDTPTLEETLDFLSEHELTVIIEIKPQWGRKKEAVQRIGTIIRKFSYKGPLVVSSRSFLILRLFNRHFPDLICALTIRRPVFSFFQAPLFAKFLKIAGIHEKLSGSLNKSAKRCRSMNLKFFTWTVCTPGEVRNALAADVDGIITDDVEMTRAELIRLTWGG
jgi:glycerophosphoryl diester phosphodiesterase